MAYERALDSVRALRRTMVEHPEARAAWLAASERLGDEIAVPADILGEVMAFRKWTSAAAPLPAVEAERAARVRQLDGWIRKLEAIDEEGAVGNDGPESAAGTR